MTAVPSQNKPVVRSLGFSDSQVAEAAWAITPGGEFWRGAGAMNRTLQELTGFPFGRIYRLPIIRQIQDLAYRLIARLRGYLPGVTPHCKEFPEDCRDTD